MTSLLLNFVGQGSLTAASGGLNPATTAWVNAVAAAGGTVSSSMQTAVNTLITGMISDGSYTQIDRLWLHACAIESSIEAIISIVKGGVAVSTDGTTTLVSSGTITFSSQGVTGNGTTGYFDSKYNPSTSAVNLTQNSHSFFQYFSNNRGTGGASDAKISMGATNGTGTIQYLPMAGFDVAPTFMDIAQVASTAATTQGMYFASRTSSNALALYHNSNAAASTASGNPDSLTTINLYICARNNSSAADSFDDDSILCTGWGAGLSSAAALSLQNRINTFMTTLGVNTY